MSGTIQVMNRNSHHKLVGKIASKRTIDKNSVAFQTYDSYKKTIDIIDRADLASGKGLTFESGTGSTLNFEINPHGAHSTTAQKI